MYVKTTLIEHQIDTGVKECSPCAMYRNWQANLLHALENSIIQPNEPMVLPNRGSAEERLRDKTLPLHWLQKVECSHNI